MVAVLFKEVPVFGEGLEVLRVGLFGPGILVPVRAVQLVVAHSDDVLEEVIRVRAELLNDVAPDNLGSRGFYTTLGVEELSHVSAAAREQLFLVVLVV